MLVDLTQLQNISLNDEVIIEIDQVDLLFNDANSDLPTLQFTVSIYDKTGTKLDTLQIPIGPTYETQVLTYKTTDENVTKVEDLQEFQNDLQELYKKYGKENVSYNVDKIVEDTSSSNTNSTTNQQTNTKKIVFNVTVQIKTGLYWDLINYSCNNKKIAFCFFNLVKEKIVDILQSV